MKNIVVIARYFAPDNEIAAVRPTKLAKFLKESGQYSITVITTVKSPGGLKDSLLEHDLKYVDRIIRISGENGLSRFLGRIILWVKSKHNGCISEAGHLSLDEDKKQRGMLRKIKVFLEKPWDFLKFVTEYQRDRNFYRNAKRYLKHNQQNYDIILSTFGPYAVHQIGRYMKRNQESAFWIADFRDGPLNDFVPKLFRRYAQNYPNRICRGADLVTAVSQGVLDELGLPGSMKVKVIPNGYDQEDIEASTKKVPNGKMTFTYTGTLYRGKSDLTPLFRALSELMEQGCIEKPKIVLQYAGAESSRFMEQTALYHLDDIVVSYGNVEREKALRLQWESDILFLASWNQSGKTGVVTGKLLEYMMMDRPILSLISGELPNSKIREIIETCKLGFCYEQANGEKDYVELKKYILEQYNEFLSTGMAAHQPNQQKVEQYNYKNIAERFTALLS